MARFTYTAEKAGGEVYTGITEAADRFELYTTIRREGGRLVSFDEQTISRHFFSFEFWNALITTVPEQQKILLSRNLGSMLQAGLPLSRALAVIEHQTRNPKLKNAVNEIASDVRHGETLNVSLKKFPAIFSSLLVAMVRAGEEGGDLASALILASEQMERASSIKKKIHGALIYPTIILIVIVGITILMMVEVVPTLSSTFKEMGATLPLSTRFIIGASDFMVAHYSFAVALFIAIPLSFFALLRTPQGKRGFEYVLLHTPTIKNIVREVNAARTSRTLASLLSSGVDVLSSLEITGDVVQNLYFREVIKNVSIGIAKGESLSSGFARRDDLYPSFVGEMMAVGEETGALAEMLKRLALYYEDEVDRKTKDLSTIIEPFLMVAIGAAVGFFAISMISPIYQLSQNI